MKFLMLVLVDPDLENPEDGPISIEEWVGETYDKGLAIEGDRLRPPADAKTIRRRGGKAVVTDGPFAETREIVAGFDILDVESLDQAIEIASRHPQASSGLIELRPVWPLDL